MASRRLGTFGISGIVLLLCLGGFIGCMNPRPKNVPKDAVPVPAGYGDAWWQLCSYDQTNDTDHCQIFNPGGATLEDETFLPYDGGNAAKASELKIDGGNRLAGPYIICLKNGRILIPKSDFENQKRFIDFRTGKSKTM
jgi:hypothetical protein